MSLSNGITLTKKAVRRVNVTTLVTFLSLSCICFTFYSLFFGVTQSDYPFQGVKTFEKLQVLLNLLKGSKLPDEASFRDFVENFQNDQNVSTTELCPFNNLKNCQVNQKQTITELLGEILNDKLDNTNLRSTSALSSSFRFPNQVMRKFKSDVVLEMKNENQESDNEKSPEQDDPDSPNDAFSIVCLATVTCLGTLISFSPFI